MKLEIDTNKKTITILEEVPLSEVLLFIQQFNTEGYKVLPDKSIDKIQVTRLTPIIPPYPLSDPYNPYQVTCNT